MLQQDELKKDQGKPRYSLIPPKPLEAIAKVLTFGAEKYEANSWQTIEDKDRYMDALMRHIEAVRMGEVFDKESGLQHMAHVATNAMFLHHFHDQEEDKIEKDIKENIKMMWDLYFPLKRPEPGPVMCKA